MCLALQHQSWHHTVTVVPLETVCMCVLALLTTHPGPVHVVTSEERLWGCLFTAYHSLSATHTHMHTLKTVPCCNFSPFHLYVIIAFSTELIYHVCFTPLA